jgi:hypothetical protein
MKLLTVVMTLAMAVMPAASQTPKLVWKTFTNRAGWNIQYPASGNGK